MNSTAAGSVTVKHPAFDISGPNDDPTKLERFGWLQTLHDKLEQGVSGVVNGLGSGVAVVDASVRYEGPLTVAENLTPTPDDPAGGQTLDEEVNSIAVTLVAHVKVQGSEADTGILTASMIAGLLHTVARDAVQEHYNGGLDQWTFDSNAVTTRTQLDIDPSAAPH